MKYKFSQHLIGVALGMLLAGPAAAQGGFVQSYDDKGDKLQSIGGGQSPPAAAPQIADTRKPYQAYQSELIDYTFDDSLVQGAEEYRGYNGRTLEQAYLRCKYEANRGAPAGDRGKGILEKMRIRMYIMDTCMNSEGFFRHKSRFGLDLSMITSADIIF
jgi:hypothetical protein